MKLLKRIGSAFVISGIILGFLIISGGQPLALEPATGKGSTIISGKVSNDKQDHDKKRFMIVSSYHREYIWSKGTNQGVCAALLEFGYLDNAKQIEQFTRNDSVESSRALLRKTWMDTKRKNSKSEVAETLIRISREIDTFKPDIILLGDDNAANYIGNHYLDLEMPMVFWGINGLPLKYGIIDSLERPGHNVTGVYQKGYHNSCFEYLRKIVPGVKKVAVLADDSPTGRAHAKRIERYAEEGTLPVEIEEIVITNSFDLWKSKALELEPKVDAFYVATHNTLEDNKGNHVNYLKVASWYLRNIKKPETTPARFLINEGFFCTVEDSAFKQGYEAVKIAHLILAQGLKPAEIAPYFPEPGPFIVNRKRAKMLGLDDSINNNRQLIDEYIDEMVALEEYPE